MGKASGALLLSLLASTGAAAWQGPPAALAGLWYPDDAQGNEACDTFKAASDPWQVEGSLMVGALWIDGQRLHRMAEYGEGDIHQVVRSVAVSPTQWQLDVVVGIDTLPDRERDMALQLEVTLSDGLLVWNEKTPPLTRTWRRCSDTPATISSD
jgi:hypothetical protein